MASSVPRGQFDPKAGRLRIFFRKVVNGEQNIANSRDGKLFIESICAQQDAVSCIQTLTTKKTGATAIQLSLSADMSRDYLNGAPVSLLRYLQAPELKVIGGGQFLERIVLNVVDPPAFWNAFMTAQKAGLLATESTRCFAWLLLQLVSFSPEKATAYYDLARDASLMAMLLEAFDSETRAYAQKIKHIGETMSQPGHTLGENGPGGRHDNDHQDIRQITIIPTPDEISCKEPPFLRRAIDVEEHEGTGKLALHIDNQFRLLREDMLRDLREELPIALGVKQGRRRGLMIHDLGLNGVQSDGRHPWTVRLRCSSDLPGMPKADHDKRKTFLIKNYGFLKNRSLACLVANGDPACLITIRRNEDLLAEQPPILCAEFSGSGENTRRALLQLRLATRIQLFQLNTAVFTYEPVLRQLQATNQLLLRDEIMCWSSGISADSTPLQQSRLREKIAQFLEKDNLQSLLHLPSPTKLDKSQAQCFLAGLTQRLSLVQGPPGTGKSFIGALIAKAIYCLSKKTILVVCYTNHALDQFLEDLMKVGIPASSITRLGSTAKTNATCKPLLLGAQQATYKFTKSDYEVLDIRRAEATAHSDRLRQAFKQFQANAVSKSDILELLEFSSENAEFQAAFEVPEETNGMTRVGKKGKKVDEYYLLDRWGRGQDAGIFNQDNRFRQSRVWRMISAERHEALNRWKMQILQERVSDIHECGEKVNEALVDIDALYGENQRRIIQGKRIIACTTTGAAKHVQSIQSASPGVLLVEEAGEILESHILTALGPETKQMILIGDHKQLRPKAHHDLSVEKGDGYDLNRSMFERLVIKGYPHQILSEQHRMRPELSALVRHLTYPDLTDAPSTVGRPMLRGFQDHLIFVDHAVAEEDVQNVPDWKDQASPSSKRNVFEANMTLKCVRYLAQQGYGTDEIVVLTPYVAQLRLLFDVLSEENDPVLNDLDYYDLVRAGLMPVGTASELKRPLRISTIDNYQGEESDIVLVSLTRSNPRGDIGFLYEPERLNVLLSRARNALIMIGNADTFLRSRKGKELWQKLFEFLRSKSHIYDGFPVQCERHTDRKAVLRSPEDFQSCPDGGCSEPCQTILNCGIHPCPQRCHQLHDHSKMKCCHILKSKCPVGHLESRQCHANKPAVCRACEKKRLADEKKQQEEFKRQQERSLAEQKHNAQIAELDEQMRVLRDRQQDIQRSREMMRALEQKKHDLENTKVMVARMVNPPEASSAKQVHLSRKSPPVKSGKYSGPTKQSNPSTVVDVGAVGAVSLVSPSEIEWERMKSLENVSNDALDSLMKMTGLEHVKEQFLTVKARIDTTQRQGTDLKKERFGVVLLGNPGTGKTTVARLYASFLTSMGVLSGSEFVETTGSSLASDGVAGAKKYVETILKAGGGAFFLDEAYQLALGHNYGGKSVLDYLLAEIENQVGKIVFIFAGYDKQMEAFFEHNPGLGSRMPYQLRFDDYNDKELLLMLARLINRKYADRMQVEGGLHGLFNRIVVRRVGRGRGKEGFGNARALENVLAKISERQAARLRRERTSGMQPDDFIFTKEDLIGPEPTAAVSSSSAWKELQGMVGLKAVKDAIRSFLDRINVNYQRELEEKPPIEVSLNRVLVGSPGTGKTTVGKLYGQILADVGLLSSAEVVLKNPTDFTGSVLGQSEENTRAILKATQGKVLIIDEAYMLGSGGGVGQATDPYKTAIIDTIVAEVQSTPGEDRCVLLLGYEEQMTEMFRNTNPGLSRRFPLADAFHFEDFDDDQLGQILDFKLRKQGLNATKEAKDVAIKVLAKARRRLHFGNAGEVENIISHAKASFQLRQSSLLAAQRSIDVVFEEQDFDANFDRAKDSASNLKVLFKDIVGSGEIVKKFEGYIRTVEVMRARGKEPDDQIPFNFIFKGPPGTGKTTTARKIGQIYYDMGFLSSTDVHECSATDLVAGYVGQTGLKTVQVLDEALGAVLFIDEAYRLAEGNFATEAVNTLVDSLTKPKYIGKMLVVLAGYEHNMNDLLKVNPGLSSRFPEEVVFKNMHPDDCFGLLRHELKKDDIVVNETGDESARVTVIEKFQALSELPSWGNGRDVKTLAKSISRSTFQMADVDTASDLVVALPQLVGHIDAFLEERRSRETSAVLPIHSTQPIPPMASGFVSSRPPSIMTSAKAKVQASQINEAQDPRATFEASPDQREISPSRDTGVPDHIWRQLQDDRKEQETLQMQAEAHIEAVKTQAETAAAELLALARQMEKDRESDELKREHEATRLKKVAALLAARHAEDEQKREVAVQKKLRQMGVCPVGYRWIKQADGYRCAGGSHFVSTTQLGVE